MQHHTTAAEVKVISVKYPNTMVQDYSTRPGYAQVCGHELTEEAYPVMPPDTPIDWCICCARLQDVAAFNDSMKQTTSFIIRDHPELQRPQASQHQGDQLAQVLAQLSFFDKPVSEAQLADMLGQLQVSDGSVTVAQLADMLSRVQISQDQGLRSHAVADSCSVRAAPSRLSELEKLEKYRFGTEWDSTFKSRLQSAIADHKELYGREATRAFLDKMLS